MPSNLDIALDRTSPMPLYHQVASAFEQAIREGTLPPKTKLENEVALAKRYNLSRPTMRQAMDHLVREGLVVRRRGVGTQVIGPQVRRSLRLSSLYSDLEEEGVEPETRVLSLKTVSASHELAQHLKIHTGSKVYHVVRLRLVDHQPLALMENWIPVTVANLSASALRNDGLYNLMRKAGVDFRMAHQTVGATAATKEQAKTLETAPGSPLVRMERTALDGSGTTVEHGAHLYRADRYSFAVTLVN